MLAGARFLQVRCPFRHPATASRVKALKALFRFKNNTVLMCFVQCFDTAASMSCNSRKIG